MEIYKKYVAQLDMSVIYKDCMDVIAMLRDPETLAEFLN